MHNYLTQKFNISKTFKRFNQKYDVFNRSLWDDQVNPKVFYKSYDIANFKPKKSEGFDHWDYALRNASWHLADFIGERTPGRNEGITDLLTTNLYEPPEKIELASPRDTADRIKKAAKILGAGMVGICEVDQRWIYSHRFNRATAEAEAVDLPSQFKYAIMIITPMDYEVTKTIPSATGGTATGVGYARAVSTATALAQFIANLGYEAFASMNDTALNIPMAIQAGLGEYGRHGLLITPAYGPRVRISKVFTDLPLAIDQPREMGVEAFCNICQKCSDACPVKAIPAGEPQAEPPNVSSLTGIRKWTVNAEKCFKFWVGMNTDCAICIRVCPYNKDFSKWYNRLALRLSNSFLRTFLLRLDGWLKFGERLKPNQWWQKRQ